MLYVQIHAEKMIEERKRKKQEEKKDRENPLAREERLKKVREPSIVFVPHVYIDLFWLDNFHFSPTRVIRLGLGLLFQVIH